MFFGFNKLLQQCSICFQRSRSKKLQQFLRITHLKSFRNSTFLKLLTIFVPKFKEMKVYYFLPYLTFEILVTVRSLMIEDTFVEFKNCSQELMNKLSTFQKLKVSHVSKRQFFSTRLSEPKIQP